MQSKSLNRSIDLYLFYDWLHRNLYNGLFPPAYIQAAGALRLIWAVLWRVMLRHRFPKSIRIDSNQPAVKQVQTFRIRYESFLPNDCSFNLELYTRTP